MKNSGHRLGNSGALNENTLESLIYSIENSIFEKKDFKYWEFDVHESDDGVLFVFHDDEILFEGEINILRKMNFLDIYELGANLGINIPRLSEVIGKLSTRSEKVMIEIKNLQSENGRKEVIESISERDNWFLMSTPERFTKSFPEESRDYWHSELSSLGGKMVRVGRHRIDLFKASKSKLKWEFTKIKWFFGF